VTSRIAGTPVGADYGFSLSPIAGPGDDRLDLYPGRRTYNPDRNIGATFQTLSGASFVVNGAAQAHDSALTTASAEVKWMNGWSAAVTCSYAGKGVVGYSWRCLHEQARTSHRVKDPSRSKRERDAAIYCKAPFCGPIT